MNKQSLSTLLIAAAGFAATGQIASATSITVTGTGYGANTTIIVNGSNETDFAGQILINLNGTTPLITYCLDIFTPIGYSTYNSTLISPSAYGRAAWLVETYASTVTTNNQGAALQIALWDVVHDGGNGLSTGSIRMSSGTLRTLANSMITASVGRSSLNATVINNANIPSGLPAQTLITSGIYYAPPGSVPEPSTLVMMAAGLGLLGRRKIFQREGK